MTDQTPSEYPIEDIIGQLDRIKVEIDAIYHRLITFTSNDLLERRIDALLQEESAALKRLAATPSVNVWHLSLKSAELVRAMEDPEDCEFSDGRTGHLLRSVHTDILHLACEWNQTAANADMTFSEQNVPISLQNGEQNKLSPA